jgi:hypothetical protein
MEPETIQKNYIQDLEIKVKELETEHMKTKQKLIWVQTHYERIDQLYDKALTLLDEKQKSDLASFFHELD